MAYKWSMLLTIVFVFQLLLMSGDITATQVIHGHLQALATHVGHHISQQGQLSPELIQWVESKTEGIRCDSGCAPQFGDTLTFTIYQTFRPMILSNEPITISVTRYAVIGLYY